MPSLNSHVVGLYRSRRLRRRALLRKARHASKPVSPRKVYVLFRVNEVNPVLLYEVLRSVHSTRRSALARGAATAAEMFLDSGIESVEKGMECLLSATASEHIKRVLKRLEDSDYSYQQLASDLAASKAEDLELEDLLSNIDVHEYRFYVEESELLD